ncbi:tumor necrosis factor receptor superfamily member 19 isoform X1 [Takifugu rubripes]|uniref:tumor necrosis factor receptor superfamily member 19 isoform X1 n=1 Tax=Takifugu rubripes TaxID=31033 RepID=UPI0011452311|nr:tumor necrosis factor receptor superfamily member 19 isoform X1 [Takifugu rubripes]XP_029700104.1 tumor necrosis factor receptor superfamily member 19 isoform X1 [Takifugu rubripes]XP_029700105.1 tumor necrosis factor receptor superfamily member 19 isoform X1 [Takifugu rubripes]
MVWMLQPRFLSLLLSVQLIFLTWVPARAEEQSRECREQEYKDRFGNCKACKQCDAGQELSKECGFGYGEGARCVPCRNSRFKEDRSLQKCKPCLDCGLINRFQKGNCSSTSNAVCGDCLPGYYRKTKLRGFQDMECIPCGDAPPPYEPHCSGRVNLVPLPPVATSPRDVALAAVICSALATVLLALLVLCVIYCKRQLLEKKPSAASLRSHDCPYSGAELSCLDPHWLHDFPHRPCCQCHLGPGHTCGPVHLIPSLCCDESYSLALSQGTSVFQSQMNLSDRNTNQDEDTLMQLGRLIEGDRGEPRERWTEWTSQNHNDPETEVPPTQQRLSSQEG